MNYTSSGVQALHWKGPYTFQELLGNASQKDKYSVPGVYLWLDRVHVPEAITYVGRATGTPDLWLRQWSHYTSLIAGHYQIPEWSRPDQSRWEMDPAKSEVIATVFDKQRYHVLVDEGFRYAKGIHVYLCPLATALVKQVERQLLYELCPLETSWGTRTPPLEMLNILHHDAGWVTPATRQQIRESVNIA